jgi:hypothetical protein
MSFGISISTYFGKETKKERLEYFKQSIQSLYETSFDGKVFVVDDGSSWKEHIEYVNDLNDERFFIYKKEVNGGISKTKNTGIRLILENGFDKGVLVDDDVVFYEGWDKKYKDAMEKTGIPHFTVFCDKKRILKTKFKNYEILRLPYVNGLFMTFTKKLIDCVGYFKVMPYKYGHEHSNFSLRCLHYGQIPFFCDIVDSKKYVLLIPESGKSPSIGNLKKEDKEHINKNAKFLHSKNKEICIE